MVRNRPARLPCRIWPATGTKELAGLCAVKNQSWTHVTTLATIWHRITDKKILACKIKDKYNVSKLNFDSKGANFVCVFQRTTEALQKTCSQTSSGFNWKKSHKIFTHVSVPSSEQQIGGVAIVKLLLLEGLLNNTLVVPHALQFYN